MFHPQQVGHRFSMTSEPLISPPLGPVLSGVPQSRVTSGGLKATLIDPIFDPTWDRLILSHPDATPFHSAAWAKVLATTYGHKPFYLRLTSDGETVALMPLMEVSSPFTGTRGVCLPFTDFCGALLFNEYEPQAGLREITALARGHSWKHIDFRGTVGFPAGTGRLTNFYGHEIDLRVGAEDVAARFASSVRRAIRKAEKSGVVAEVDRSRAAVLEFYKLHARTRRRHGIPPQPASFFLNIYEEIIRPGLGFVVLARTTGKLIAGAVFFQLGNKAVYKFAASDIAFQELRGSNLVIWEAIKFLVQDNCKKLHFGRTSLDNEGLRQFKRSWGAEEQMIEYLRFDIASSAWVSTPDANGLGVHKKIFSRLPLGLNRLAGSMIYPHLD